MRIKLRTTVAGPSGSGGAGQTVDFPDDFARSLVDGGYAEVIETADLPLPPVVTPQADAETAVVVPRENAARRARKVR